MGGPHKLGPVKQPATLSIIPARFTSPIKSRSISKLETADAIPLTLSTIEATSRFADGSGPSHILHSVVLAQSGFSSQRINDKSSVIKSRTSPAISKAFPSKDAIGSKILFNAPLIRPVIAPKIPPNRFSTAQRGTFTNLFKESFKKLPIIFNRLDIKFLKRQTTASLAFSIPSFNCGL